MGSVTLVPMPPSKQVGDQRYDDRIEQVLARITTGFPEADTKRLLVRTTSREAAHASDVRPTISELAAELQLINLPSRSTVWLFDDLLVTGASFRAAKSILMAHESVTSVYGVYIARRILPEE